MAVPAILCEELSYRYDGEDLPAIDGISLTIHAGQRVALLGAGGSGKSTLCQLLNGHLPRSGGGRREGVLLLAGSDPAEAPLAEVAAYAGVLFQDPDAQLVRGIVEEEAAFGPENLRVPPDEIEMRVTDSLAAVGLEGRRTDAVRSLSGGQRQRTAIAAVLALKPRLLLFDDACQGLDAASEARFLQLLGTLQEDGRTVVTASGRFDDAARAAERVIVLDGGRVVLDGPPADLLRRCSLQLAQLGLLPRPAGEAAAAAPRSGPPLLEVKSVDFTYPGGRQALRGAAFALRRGEWALLTGENGSGKSTLSRLLMGLLPAPRGRVMWAGEDTAGVPVYKMAERIGYVFQQPEHMFTAPTVWEELIYSLHGGLPPKRRKALTPEQSRRAEHLLEAAGLSGRRETSPYLLSRGERRLLAVISQLILPRLLYILDEPTTGLDYAAIDRLKDMCRQACREGSAVLIITHDPELLQDEATLLLHMENGKITAVHPAEEAL